MVYKILLLVTIFFSSLNASIKIKDLKTFKADFIQNIVSTNGKKIEYKGKVFIKNSGKILWKYKMPIIKNVYVLNDFVIVDEPELEQAIFTQLENEINIIKILKNAKKIKENKYLAKIEDIDYLIQLSKNKIEKIKYKDKLDNNILIVFNNSISNSIIDDSVFNFTAPEHYDIIRK